MARGADDEPILVRPIAAWLHHPQAGGEMGSEVLAALLAFMSDDVRYEDVPTGAVFIGHEGIREMGAGALQMSADMSFEVVQRVGGDGSYAFESICRGTNTGAIGPLPGSGSPFVVSGRICRGSLSRRAGHLATDSGVGTPRPTQRRYLTCVAHGAGDDLGQGRANADPSTAPTRAPYFRVRVRSYQLAALEDEAQRSTQRLATSPDVPRNPQSVRVRRSRHRNRRGSVGHLGPGPSSTSRGYNYLG